MSSSTLEYEDFRVAPGIPYKLAVYADKCTCTCLSSDKVVESPTGLDTSSSNDDDDEEEAGKTSEQQRFQTQPEARLTSVSAKPEPEIHADDLEWTSHPHLSNITECWDVPFNTIGLGTEDGDDDCPICQLKLTDMSSFDPGVPHGTAWHDRCRRAMHIACLAEWIGSSVGKGDENPTSTSTRHRHRYRTYRDKDISCPMCRGTLANTRAWKDGTGRVSLSDSDRALPEYCREASWIRFWWNGPEKGFDKYEYRHKYEHESSSSGTGTDTDMDVGVGTPEETRGRQSWHTFTLLEELRRVARDHPRETERNRLRRSVNEWESRSRFYFGDDAGLVGLDYVGFSEEQQETVTGRFVMQLSRFVEEERRRVEEYRNGLWIGDGREETVEERMGRLDWL